MTFVGVAAMLYLMIITRFDYKSIIIIFKVEMKKVDKLQDYCKSHKYCHGK